MSEVEIPWFLRHTYLYVKAYNRLPVSTHNLELQKWQHYVVYIEAKEQPFIDFTCDRSQVMRKIGHPKYKWPASKRTWASYWFWPILVTNIKTLYKILALIPTLSEGVLFLRHKTMCTNGEKIIEKAEEESWNDFWWDFLAALHILCWILSLYKLTTQHWSQWSHSTLIIWLYLLMSRQK